MSFLADADIKGNNTFFLYLCMNAHVSVSVSVCVAVVWASIKQCCCRSSELRPSCQLFLQRLLSSSNRSCRRSLYLNIT